MNKIMSLGKIDLVNVSIESKNGKTKSFKSFKSSKNGFETNNKEVTINLTKKTLFSITAKTKKCNKISITFAFKNEGTKIHRHNETVDTFVQNGVDEDISDGKSMYFLTAQNKESYINFANKLPCKFLSYFLYKKDGDQIIVDFVTEFPIGYQGTYKSETLEISENETVDALTKFINKSSTSFKKPIGWSTWDYYFTDINEDCVKENTDFIYNDKKLSKYIEYIAIDDGWEHYEGLWKEGSTFPKGLKPIASYITKKGFKPGIWTCPVRFNTLCPVIMRRNDFLIKNEYDDPLMFDGCYVLDPTHPDGEKFIRETFTYLRSCGFLFYKLDFISYLLAAKKFYDKKAGPHDAIRRLMQIVRDCVGKESHIMGCNTPYGIGEGYIDSRRYGLDIHNNFGHITKCMEVALPEILSNRLIFQGDMDYLIVRGNETSLKDIFNPLNPTAKYWEKHQTTDFIWRKGPDFNYNEAKIWGIVQLVTGSSLFLGDRLSKLNKKGLNLIYTVLENSSVEQCQPIDYYSKPFPTIWQNSKNIAIINNTSKNKTFEVSNVKDGTYYDIFTKKTFKPQNNKIKLTLLPHDGVYLTSK